MNTGLGPRSGTAASSSQLVNGTAAPFDPKPDPTVTVRLAIVDANRWQIRAAPLRIERPLKQSATSRQQAQVTVLRITDELASLAEHASAQAAAVMRNARRALFADGSGAGCVAPSMSGPPYSTVPRR